MLEKIIIHLIDLRKKNINDYLDSPFLSDDDLNLTSEYKVEEMRNEKLISRYFKNKYVGEYYIGERGKPLSDKMFFNVSHSHSVVVFTSYSSLIGVDIELVREVKEPLIDYVTSEDEKEYISSNEERFYEIWTLKESLLKMDGCGISSNLKKINMLPIERIKTFNNHEYQNRIIKYDNYVISLSVNTLEDFEVIIMEE